MIIIIFDNIMIIFDNNMIIVRCCKPSDLTYTLELEKQLKRNRFKKFIDSNQISVFTKLELLKQF